MAAESPFESDENEEEDAFAKAAEDPDDEEVEEDAFAESDYEAESA